MIVLFAFLHHLAAFALVAAFAIEFVLLRGELTLWVARRLQVTDASDRTTDPTQGDCDGPRTPSCGCR